MRRGKGFVGKVAVFFLCALLTLSLCSCTGTIEFFLPESSRDTKVSSSPSSNPLADNNSVTEATRLQEKLSAVKEISQAGCSDYGYLSLDDEEKLVYEAFLQAFLSLEREVVINNHPLELIDKVLLYIENDYPLLDWIDQRYTYQRTLNLKLKITFGYTKDLDTLYRELSSIKKVADAITDRISSELPDFDKAILAHDLLLADLSYDKEALNKSTARGAFLDKSAACVGYAKAYQYLLCKLKLDALIIYGRANEPHAWNAVLLGESYYYADPTWNDVDNSSSISNGTNEKRGGYISHEYTFLSKKQLLKTHTFDADKWNYPLPVCDKEDMSFAYQKGLLVESDSLLELEDRLSSALSLALANDSNALQIGFTNEKAFYSAMDRLDTGELDSYVYSLCEERIGRKAVARSSNNKLLYLTYILEE